MSMEEVRQAVLASIETETSAFQTASEGLSQFDEGAAALGGIASAISQSMNQLSALKEKFEESSGTYNRAIEEADNATGQISDALAGSVTPEAAAAIGAYITSKDSLDEMDARVQAVDEDLDDLVEQARLLKNALDSKHAELAAVSAEASARQSEVLAAAAAAAETAAALYS